MRRANFVQSCIFACGVTFVAYVQAEDVGLSHYPFGQVQFSNALNADEASREGFLNSFPDADLLKSRSAKKGDGRAKATINIFGSIRNNQSFPVCGLVLANGQFMFSCSPIGTYSLDVPQDSAGQVTLFGFADGHFPYKQVLSAGGRYDMTLNIASVTPPPVVTNSTITFTITDGCNNGVPIDYKFYDVTNNLVWPTSTTHYATQAYNATYNHDLSCNTGAKVCYGARSATYYWGVDVDDSKSCTDCCIFCQSGNSLSRRLTC